MHKTILAAVAAAALFAPAVAQQMNQEMRSQTGQHPHALPPLIPGSSQALSDRAISPEILSAHQIRDIQQALADRGARSIRVDGQWGPSVEAAIQDFQKSENMISQDGELDPLTLIALGLDPLSLGLPDASETTGQAVHGDAAPRERSEDAPQPQPIPGGKRER